MIPILQLSSDRLRVDALLSSLRLKPQDIVGHAKAADAVNQILDDVLKRGDDAIVASSRKFDDPDFSADQIRVTPDEMKSAAGRVSGEVMSALRRSIAQVREY